MNIAAFGLALAAGALAAVKAPLALVLVLVMAVAAALYLHPRAFVPLLIASVYFGAVAVGGIPLARLVGPIALPVAVIAGIRHNGFDLRGTRLPFWIAGYTALALASIYWSQSIDGTYGLLFSLALAIVYMLAIVVLTRTRADLRLALAAFPAAAVVLFALGVVAFAIGDTPENARTLIGDRNFAAAFMAISLPVSVILAIGPRHRWERPLGVVASVCAVVGIIKTGSQGGALALLGVTIIGAVIGPRPHLRRRIAPALVVALPLIVTLVVVILSAGGPNTSSDSIKMSIERSSIDRLNLWRGALHAYRPHPLTGIGYGAYAEHSAQYMLDTPGVNLKLYNLPTHPQEAHNTYVEELTELGPLGLGLFTALIASCLMTLGKILRRARLERDVELEQFSLALILSIAGFAIASFFLSVATNRGWWVIFGLTIAAARIAYDERLAKRSGSERSAVNNGEIFTR